MSPPTTPTHEIQAPSSKPQDKEMDSFYAALDENQRDVVDKTMEHTQGEAEPRLMLNGTGDPATCGATARLASVDDGETELQQDDGAGSPEVLHVVPGGDSATAAGDVPSGAESMSKTDTYHAEEELPTEDLLSKMRSLRTTIESRISGINDANGRGRTTVRSGSQRGSSNFFHRLKQCEQFLKQAQDADTQLSAKLSESCAAAHDGGGIGGQSDAGIWASSRGDMGKFQAAVRVSAKAGLQFYQDLDAMTTGLAKEIDFRIHSEDNEADDNKTSSGSS
ncbi:hypothetical protein B0T11DRAFT_294589 [Plectosphaerella cucumerina]|uniref:Uncharacterized protein n=1 Tax=Plectosphaerella cucumerina TaxID=40658 RepID=A0A8K0XA57_9PEZI|nr:hypothetical protein B0T11DRAFT_294589 [Plectosphaerella cucumerina]